MKGADLTYGDRITCFVCLDDTGRGPRIQNLTARNICFCQRMFSFFYSMNLSPGRISPLKLRIKCETSFFCVFVFLLFFSVYLLEANYFTIL